MNINIYERKLNSLFYIAILSSIIYLLYLIFSDGLFYLKEIIAVGYYPIFKGTAYGVSDKTKFMIIYFFCMISISAQMLDKEEKRKKLKNIKLENELISNLMYAIVSIGFIVYRIVYLY